MLGVDYLLWWLMGKIAPTLLAAHDCPYGCDPIKAFGGPNLGRPYSTLAGLMMFVAGMYFSDRGLERRPFAFKHIGGWLVAVFGGCFFLLGTLPYVLTIIWEML